MIDQEIEHREPSQAVVASMIANTLGETNASARQSIARIVRAIGRTQSLQLLNYALQAEEHGGLLTRDKKRRRTVGGIFFFYARIYGKPKEGKKLPWQEDRIEKPKKGPAPAQTAKLSLQSSERAVSTIKKGIATTVKITLVGRPGFILDKGEFVVVTMENTKAPSLPKGLPAPANPSTHYGVYIAAKQWKKVAEAVKDPEDSLIVEGYPQVDVKLGAIAVYATNTTTKKTQQAAKQAQQEASAASQK